MTESGKHRDPLAGVRRAAQEFLSTGGSPDRLRAALDEVIASEREQPATALRMAAPSRVFAFDRAKYSEIIGDSEPILEVLRLIDKVAVSNIPLLIQGESGTGKELVARAIHNASPRRDKPFITENCAAIPETLLESELFGYKRGAFTGADRDHKGLFQVADKGTVFLDEIGDMSLPMQSKLLRVLQDGEIRPVGGTASTRVDVRVVSASNRILREMVVKQTFREDLYYRLSGVTIELPPLRDRPEDIPTLAEFFLKRVAGEMKRPAPAFGPSALAVLARHRWPGNIRELENEIRRCLALLRNETTIQDIHLSDDVRHVGAGK